MTVEIEGKKFLFSMPRERRPFILDKVSQVLEEIEKEGEICGYIFFAFMPSGEVIETWCEYQGLVNPVHVAEALASYGILSKVTAT